MRIDINIHFADRKRLQEVIEEAVQKCQYYTIEHRIQTQSNTIKNIYGEGKVVFLKIDGAFVRRLNENKEDQGIVKTISSVAKSFGIKTIAEFVENKETIHLLKSFQVDYAQGFYIGKPAPQI